MMSVLSYIYNHKQKILFSSIFFLIISISIILLVPTNAYAAPNILTDPAGWIKETLLVPSINALLQAGAEMLQNVSTDNLLTGNFKNLFATGQQSDQVWDVINTIHQSLVVPVGHSILAAAILVQLVKISQKVDANATLPTVKEIFILVVFFVVFSFMINHGPEICEGIYNVFNEMARGIHGTSNISSSVGLGDTSNTDIGFLVMMLIPALFVFLGSFAAAIIAYVIAAARAIQLYVMAVFSPIPFALLGFEETRNMGINFIKVFAAVCLAGAILVFLISVFPVIYSSMIGSNGNLIEGDGIIAGYAVKAIGLPILFMMAMIKSGSWARDILGG